MRKILIITYYWPPSGGGGVQRWLKFVKYLPASGWKPIVVCPENPEYPVIDESLENDIPPEAEIIKLPIWEPYWIFKKITGRKKEEKVNGGLLFDEKKQTLTEKIALWIRGNFLIPVPRVFWVRSSVKRLIKIIAEKNPEAIITTGPPHSVHLIGYNLKKKLGITWIADLRDPWSQFDILEKFYPSRLARARQKQLEKKALSLADKVITVSPTWANDLQKIVNTPVDFITNGFDDDDFCQNKKVDSGKFIISHVGMINSYRNRSAFWEVLNELCSEIEEINQNLLIQIVGTYNEQLRKTLEKYPNLTGKLIFSGYIPHSEVKHKYSESGCLLLLQNKTKTSKGHIPGKIFEYLASQKPVLALADPESDLGDLITNCKAGFTCNFDDKNSIKNSVKAIYKKEFPETDKEMVGTFSRKKLTENLSEILHSTIKQAHSKQNIKTVHENKKVLIITYYWPPSGGAGVQRWIKFAKYLTKLNVETFVLTVDPKFATYPQIDESLKNDIPESVKVFYAKTFELYSLYKKISTNKEIPYGGFANTKKVNFKEKVIRFVRGNFFLPDPRKGWNRYAYKKAIKLIKANNINTVITTSPPHSSQLIGLKLKRKLAINWISDFRDPWTDIYYYKQMYPTAIATAINKRYERKIFKNSDKVITVSKDLKRLFSSKLTNIEDKIKVIPNGFDRDDFTAVKTGRDPNFFYISYVGTISKEYNINGFIDGINRLPENIKSKLRIRFIGELSSELFDRMNEKGLGKLIERIGYVPHHKAIKYMFSSNVLLLIIPDVNNNEGILTGKLFEYLATNRPILFIGPVNGDAAKVIQETKSGTICSYSDVDKITNTIIQYFNSDSEMNEPKELRGIEYSRENLTKGLYQLL